MVVIVTLIRVKANIIQYSVELFEVVNAHLIIRQLSVTELQCFIREKLQGIVNLIFVFQDPDPQPK